MRATSCSHSCPPQRSHTSCFPGVETASQPFIISGNKDLIIYFSEELRGDEDGCDVPHPFRSVCTQSSPQEASLLPVRDLTWSQYKNHSR